MCAPFTVYMHTDACTHVYTAYVFSNRQECKHTHGYMYVYHTAQCTRTQTYMQHSCTHRETHVWRMHTHTHAHTGVWLPSIPRSVLAITNRALSRILTSSCSIQALPLSFCAPRSRHCAGRTWLSALDSVNSEGQSDQEPKWLHEKGAMGQPLGVHWQVQVGRTRQEPRTVMPGPTSVSPLPPQAAGVAGTHSHHFAPPQANGYRGGQMWPCGMQRQAPLGPRCLRREATADSPSGQSSEGGPFPVEHLLGGWGAVRCRLETQSVCYLVLSTWASWACRCGARPCLFLSRGSFPSLTDGRDATTAPWGHVGPWACGRCTAPSPAPELDHP